MIVYSLNNKDNPAMPFYIGITNDINRRFKQHRNNYEKHKPYVKDKDDFTINILVDTGSNESSSFLAEKIETNLIKYFNTVNYGSNKVYDVKAYMEAMLEKPFPTRSHQKLNRQNDTMREHKKFKKVVKLINKDPCRYSVEEIQDKCNYSEYAINKYSKKYFGVKFLEWLKKYQELWFAYIDEWMKNHSEE